MKIEQVHFHYSRLLRIFVLRNQIPIMERPDSMENIMKKVTLVSPSDGLEISVLTCTPQKGARGIVQLVHGMCEHKERYIPFMEFLAEEGYASIIHDHRGHGESVRSSEDLGYFYEGGYMALINDIKAVNSLAREENPGLSVVLMGHSMGSMAVRSYLKRYEDTVQALIVCGSPSFNKAAGLAKWITKLYSVIAGERHRPDLIQRLAFGSFNRRFGKVDSHNAWVCSDPEIVREYDRDPLCNFQFTNDGFINLFSLMEDAYATDGWEVHNPEMPILFISGAEDPCLVSGHKFRQAVHAIRKAGYTNVRAKLYQGMRHEILNETGKRQVWEDVAKFISGNPTPSMPVMEVSMTRS